MLTQLIKGETPLSIDPEIVALARKKAHGGYPGQTRGIAILNDAGRVYRVLGAESPQEASNVVDALCAAHGFVDRVGWDNRRLRAVDALTGTPIETPWSAVLQLGREPHPIPALPRLTLTRLDADRS